MKELTLQQVEQVSGGTTPAEIAIIVSGALLGGAYAAESHLTANGVLYFIGLGATFNVPVMLTAGTILGAAAAAKYLI